MNLVVEFRLSRNVSVSQLRCHEKFPVEMKLNTKRLRENLFSSHENLSMLDFQMKATSVAHIFQLSYHVFIRKFIGK